jgi:DNA-binding NtrC family response regulator
MNFLLIQRSHDHFWQNVLREALAPLGHLEVANEEDCIQMIAARLYHLVVIDASDVEDGVLLVSRLCARQTGLRVIVAALSPSWRTVRAAFHAGVIDCINKTFDKAEILRAVKSALATEIR